jgi:hypothetical protein
MSPREIFGIAVRVVGLLCLLLGGWRLQEWGTYAFGYSHILVAGVRPQCLFLIGAGLACLRGAELIVAFSYPPIERQSSVVTREAMNRPAHAE